jgi:hypothetical protein
MPRLPPERFNTTLLVPLHTALRPVIAVAGLFVSPTVNVYVAHLVVLHPPSARR